MLLTRKETKRTVSATTVAVRSLPIEQGQFADEVTGAEAGRPVVAGDVDGRRPLDDDEELAAGVALADEDVSGGRRGAR